MYMGIRQVFAVLLSLTVIHNVHATLQPSDSMPKCGLKCMVTVVPTSNCTLSNINCICRNAPLLASITQCVETNCTFREQLTAQRYSKHSCNIAAYDRTTSTGMIGLFGGLLAMLAFGLRIYARVDGIAGRFGKDDYVLAVAMVENIPFTVLSKLLTDDGLGQDIWELPFANLTKILKVYFFQEAIYFSIFPLIRISLLFFYLRIFSHARFKICVYILVAANALYGILFVFMTIFQCVPIYGAWTRWDGTFEGQCININLYGWVSAGINVFLHVTTIAMPMPEVLKLVLSAIQKLSIIAMFSLGLIFVTVISVLRLQNLVAFASTHNYTQDYASLGYWTTVEVHAAIICCCVPAFRSLLRKWFPKLFKGSEASKSGASKGQSLRMSITPNIGAFAKDPPWPPAKYEDDNRSFVPLVDVESRGNDLSDTKLKRISEVVEIAELEAGRDGPGRIHKFS